MRVLAIANSRFVGFLATWCLLAGRRGVARRPVPPARCLAREVG